MKLLTDWGFSLAGFRDGQHGEHLVLIQIILILGFPLLPIYHIPSLELNKSWLYFSWTIAGAIAFLATIIFIKAILDLGNGFTILPYPRSDGQLVTQGIYQIVRHPIYSGVILGGLAWTICFWSWSHLLGTIAWFIFFDFKATREEIWLTERYPDYSIYRQQVKKLIPFIY